jgi:hypothetical protein
MYHQTQRYAHVFLLFIYLSTLYIGLEASSSYLNWPSRPSTVGRERRMRYDERTGMDYAMAYAPPQTCYVRPTDARTVTLATTNAHADHPDPHPQRAHAATTMPLEPAGGAPAQRAGMQPPRKPKKKKKKKQVRFTPPGPPVPARGDDAAAAHDTATAASGGGAYHHGPPPDPSSYSPAPPPASHGYGHGYGQYAPSPLPRWEMLGTPRRHEYFSSEYRWYYPTPVREGIYSFATDANGRLTTIFSEENPNACTIV